MHTRFAVVLALGLFTRLNADDGWKQFRGPGSDGVATGSTLPLHWDESSHVLWKADIPGVGWSQPVVADGRIYLTTALAADQQKPTLKNWGPGVPVGPAMLLRGLGLSRPRPTPPDDPKNDSPTPGSQSPVDPDFPPPETEYRWMVLCLDAATGQVLWERTAREGRPAIHIHPSNSYASETPATDGQHVVAYFGMAGIYCYDTAGDLKWSKDLGAYPMQFGWGTGSSPILHQGRVYLVCDNDRESFLVALDVQTGEELWRASRDEASNWSSPRIWANSRRSELVTTGGTKMRSYDPATGELLWEMKGSGRTAMTPVADGDLLLVDSYDRLTGRSGILAAIRPGASGDISLKPRETSSEFIAWSQAVNGYRVGSPLLYQSCLYQLDQQSGIIRCYDSATGKLHYRQRLPGATGFTASPWAAAGRVYCLDQHGQTTVIKAGPAFEVLATNQLDDLFWASPAIDGNRLLLRGVERLYCIEE